MATVTKRTWLGTKGVRRTAWVCSYVDPQGNRHRKQFSTKREADEERVRVEGEIARGVHVPDRNSILVKDAGRAFLSDFEELVRLGKRELSTFRGYDQHIRLHIETAETANKRLSTLSGPDCVTFARKLEQNLSEALALKVLSTLKSVIQHARLNGWIAHDPITGVSIRTAGARTDESDLEIPSKAELSALLAASKRHDNTGRAEAFVTLLLFGGLRISELRGIRHRDLKLDKQRIEIRQRADKWQRIGPVKTKNSRRSVPLPSVAIQALRVWLLASPHSELDLVFPTGAGKPESYANLYNRLWRPLMHEAGLAEVLDREDKAQLVKPKYGLHVLRHAAVSLWIEEGVAPKKIMSWAGHGSIQFTMDTYGHLWDDKDGDAEISEAVARRLQTED